MSKIQHHPHLEFFCGTGGVGKTSLSLSRALQLSASHSVLLMTIDPSLRLKDLLGINADKQFQHIQVLHHSMDLIFLNTEQTLSHILGTIHVELKNQRILSLLAKPFGGLSEILGLIQLSLHLEQKKYDYVIIDTAPGGHFLDFIDGLERVRNFFDDYFIQIFNIMGLKSQKSFSFLGADWMKKAMSSGIEKLLTYLNKVTGESFVSEFIETVGHIYKVKDHFKNAADLLQQLTSQELVTFFVVTTIEHDKQLQAIMLKTALNKLNHARIFAVINKTLPAKFDHEIEHMPAGPWREYSAEILRREQSWIQQFAQEFDAVFTFPKLSSTYQDLQTIKNIQAHVHIWEHIQQSRFKHD